MVEEKKDEDKHHDSDDEHQAGGLLGSISKAVAEAEDLLSSIKVKDNERDDDDSSQTGDESVLSYYGYEEDDELSLHEELENLDDLEKDLALKLRKAEAHAIQRAEKAHAPQVVRPPGEGKGRRARARNARERREREARENAGKEGGDDEQRQLDQGSPQQGASGSQRLSTAGGKNGDTDSVVSYTSRGTKGEVRAPFEGKGRRARARRARERRESQGCESSEADGRVVRTTQGPTSTSAVPTSVPTKLNPAAPPVSPPFEGKGRRARARRARERWANTQYEANPQYDASAHYDGGYHYDPNYHGAMPVHGEIHYYQHHQCA